MLTLYTASTPNGWKVSVMLEELGADYTVVPIDLAALEQKSPTFLAICPNGRIPALTDSDFAIFESGAILIYLAEKFGCLAGNTAQQRSEVMQWLMFQVAGVGPMMGQANVFYRAMDEKLAVPIQRYQNESRRLFEVLDQRLQRQEWLAAEMSIADIANWCWVRLHAWSGVPLDDLANLVRWKTQLDARPAFQRGIEIPNALMLPDDPDNNPNGVNAISKVSRAILTR